MPIKHAALKELRKDRRRHERNQAVASALKTLTKRLVTLLGEKKFDEARTLIRVVVKQYDHAATKGVIHRKTASRKKARLMRRLHRAATPGGSA